MSTQSEPSRSSSTDDVMNRRTLLQLAGAGFIGIGASGADPSEALAPASSQSESSVEQIHLSMAAYSVREALESGTMTLFEFIDWCGELGLSGTELTSYYFPENPSPAFLHRLKRRAWSNGLTVSGTAVGNDFCLPPGSAERQEQIDYVKRWIDYSVEMYAPHVRVFAGSAPDGVERATAMEWAVAGIRECLNYAEARGVMLGLENHGGVTAPVSAHLEICDRVGDHPWFGINLDTGNYHSDDVYGDLARAAPRAVNVQYKVEIEEGGTRKPSDPERIRDLLIEANYRGWLALEYEAEEDPREAVPEQVRTLKRAFG